MDKTTARIRRGSFDPAYGKIWWSYVSITDEPEDGHKFILAMCYCGILFPEVIPMKFKTNTDIAEVRVSIFCRMGLPNEILTVRKETFFSNLLMEFCKLFRIMSIKTSTHQIVMDGYIERQKTVFAQQVRQYLQWPMTQVTSIPSVRLPGFPTGVHQLLSIQGPLWTKS